MPCPDDLLRSLADRLGAPVGLIWTGNRAVYLSLRPGARRWTLRLHRAFQGAPAPVWDALARFLRTGERSWLGPARDHFERHRDATAPGRRAEALEPRGKAHDLGQVLAGVAAHPVFGGLPPVQITWGRRARPGRRHVRLGSYREGEPALIRVHPVLDDRRVPRYVVGDVVHHELSHHRLARTGGGRLGRSHGPAFRELERAFPDHARATAWQRRHLEELLARARRRRGAPT